MDDRGDTLFQLVSPDLQEGLQGVRADIFQKAFLEQRPPVLPQDTAMRHVVQYGTREEIRERLLARPRADEITDSV
eukprot:12816219-Alexandrium_andersonii.AAC.1